ncbi:hypothetical protein AGOR_G00196790 [Albula goreensis]|uniref:Uncharacterized protein n=1 Tax=Albula goreensis TaxID=1534307 RepID=A0A8T3CS39_9TELE|nr:hypothetical protein AGOR_G00196790 [Albula goreensis]
METPGARCVTLTLTSRTQRLCVGSWAVGYLQRCGGQLRLARGRARCGQRRFSVEETNLRFTSVQHHPHRNNTALMKTTWDWCVLIHGKAELCRTSLDPDAPDQAADEEPLHVEDEGSEDAEDEGDPALHHPAPPSGKAPTRPAALRPVPSPPPNRQLLSSPALLVPLGQTLRLTGALRARRAAGLPAHVEKKADELARLWTALPHGDKLRLLYPSHHQDRLMKACCQATFPLRSEVIKGHW